MINRNETNGIDAYKVLYVVVVRLERDILIFQFILRIFLVDSPIEKTIF